jgi:alcohol dehydrogenase class IV
MRWIRQGHSAERFDRPELTVEGLSQSPHHKFEFATAARIIFGQGTIREIGPLAAEMGNSAFVITGSSTKRAEPLLAQLNNNGIKYITFNVTGEPTTVMVKQAVEQARQSKPDLVIGFGGGSVLDTGKVIAAMMTNTGRLEEYLEVVGEGKPVKQSPMPYIAIPTTAGTGAEVTRNAVLGVPEQKVKVSMRSPLMLPRIAVVDSELTYSMPPDLTAGTGLDALTQLIEAYVSSKANPLIDGICREGIKRAGRSLRNACEDGDNRLAREDMSLASLFSGLALANAGLGAVHGFAGPLGGMISAPHGVICARFLPYVMQANVQALKTRQADSPCLTRYDEVARLLIGKTKARADDGVAWVQELCETLKVQSLTEFGLKEQDFAEVAAKAQRSSSMKGNPVKLTEDELMKILKMAV